VRTEITAPRVVGAVTLAAVAAVLWWNIDQFIWVRSYDGSAMEHYAHILGHEHRLPRESEVDVWHNPPLFFLLAEGLYVGSHRAGASSPGAFVQSLSALAVLATIVLTALIARELFPRSRWIPVLALVLAAMTPVLIRAGIQFHPEPLATALTTAGLYAAIRTLARGTFSLRAGLAIGVLLGLSNLTRTWAMAALGAVLLGLGLAAYVRRDRASVETLAAAAGAAVVLMTPWLVAKTYLHGSPLAYSQPVAAQWREHGRPRAFWLPPAPADVVRRPYSEHFTNRLLPVLYADWWGDYWRTYRIPEVFHNEPEVLDAEYERPLQRQAAVGWIVALGSLGGLVALAVRAVRRRDLAVATLLLSLGFLALSFVGFLVRYPKLDGDNIKAMYVLSAAPVLAIAAACAFGRLAARGIVWLTAVAIALAVVIVPTIGFVILPGG
jgi:4-amino-4-deoxy-L-arabinose transferase-like glycosyltransferase